MRSFWLDVRIRTKPISKPMMGDIRHLQHGNNNDIHNYNRIIPRDVTQSKHISQIPAPSVAGDLALELPEPSA